MSILLDTGKTFQGVASSASAVTYTISGDEVSTQTGLGTFKMLAQNQLAAVTGTLYTVPSNTATIIKDIEIANTSASIRTVVLYVAGSASSNQIFQIAIPANGSASYGDDGWNVYDSNGVRQYVGSTGPIGLAATVAAGSTTTAAPGTSASVSNSGTTSAAVFNFTIPAGSVWRSGTGVPSNGTGLDGDYYLRTSTGDVYLRASGTYSIIENLIGPTGPAGPVSGFTTLGSSANANGGTISGSNIVLQPASIAFGGYFTASNYTKLKGLVFDVFNDYGGDPTGVADATTAINNAVAAAQTAGFLSGSAGIVWYGSGRFKTSSTINVTGHNVTFEGCGGGSSLDSGNYYNAMGAAIVPNSTFTAVVVKPVITNGLTGQPNVGFKWKGVAIDGYSANATIGLQLVSCTDFFIDDFYAINCTDTALDFNTLPAAALTVAAAFPLSAATITVNNTAASGSGQAFASTGTIILKDGTGTPRAVTYTGLTGTTFTGASSGGLGSGSAAIGTFAQILPVAQDTTRGVVGQVNIRALDGGAGSGIGIRLNGDLGGAANTNLIHFNGSVKIAHLNGVGIKDINSDTNTFDSVIINRASGGTGIGAEIGAGAANTFASRNNVFGNCSFGAGGLTLRGTPTNTFPSGPTIVREYQIANGEALPTVEAGAILDVRNYNGAFRLGNLTAPTITTQALTAATLNIVNGTKFPVPPQGFLAGAHLVWYIPMIKTAVGTSWLFNIRYGTGAVGTGAILQTITYTATINIDGGILEIHSIISALGSGTSAANTGYAILRHDLAATGLATGVTSPASDATAPAGFIYTRPTFAGFDSTLPATGVPQFLFVEINPVTASTVQTIQPGAQAFCLAQANV